MAVIICKCGLPKVKARNAARSRGFEWKCKPCANAAQKRRYAKDSTKARANTARWRARHPQMSGYQLASNLKHNYGMSIEQYDAMLVAQGGTCAVCAAEPTTARLNVDHDHRTGRVRALLCGHCNKALGFVDDDPARLRALAAYVEAF